MNKKVQELLQLPVLSIFLLLTVGTSFSSHMFLDGVTMAAISRNLSVGLGSYWDMFYTTDINHFISHPPFGLWLESILFRIIGDKPWVESLFGWSLGIFSIYLISKLWKKVTGKTSGSWWVILITLFSPILTWCFNNNMLENSVVVLLLIYTLLVIEAFNSNNILKLSLFSLSSGIIMFLALSTKGPPTLFPIILPLVIPLFLKKFSIKKGLTILSLILLTIMLSVGITYLISGDEFMRFISRYIRHQLLPSINGDVEVSPNRLLILQILLKQLLLGLILIVISITTITKKKNILKENSWIIVLIVLGLAGSLPFLIFKKQMAWYLMPSIPFFTIAISILTAPIAEKIEVFIYKKIGVFNNIITIFTACLVLISLFSTTIYKGKSYLAPEIVIRDIFSSGKDGSNKDKARFYSEYTWQNFNLDIVNQKVEIPVGSSIATQETLHDFWRMNAYFQRVYSANLSLRIKSDGDFFIAGEVSKDNFSPFGFRPISNKKAVYNFFEKTNK
ncbi:MAG: glycosyltransferase family 39 protein [Spirochaetaceae bacterium]